MSFLQVGLAKGPDYTKYHLAGAMLSYIRHTESFNEGMYFVDESID
ncbi:hypothetical protein HMPREF3182_00871 [Megasphaera hutchinsoni]|uniref:Uncharacterized protein n=1 Tax=Megasphaera hutchinsoni TaxID=1588748 RepID=A0A134CFV0_9FIRM|nr:hypothetical protein HMPREF3182_00871 [Megasphaera hutchinsoni]